MAVDTGVVKGIIFGVGALILAVVVVLVVVNTVEDANLLRATATTTNVINESGHINSTGYTLSNYTSDRRSFAIVTAFNYTSGVLIPSGNFTLSSTGVVTNATPTMYNKVTFNYTFIPPTSFENTEKGMSGNFTGGIGNVSSKIPTILLIAAVVLLFGVIFFLVRYYREMGIGNQGSSL